MKAILIIFSLLYVSNLFAQSNEIQREIKYTAEAGIIISTNGETPFWLKANQYGIVPNQSPIFTLRGSVSSDYKKAITKEDKYKLSKFDWGYGLNIVGNVGKENQVLIPEAYVKAKFGGFEIYGGRRKEIFGLVDSTLSSGSYIWSGNALPMPKIQISTPNFVPLGFTKDFLSFKGNYAHGWFENNRTDVKNFYLHQKSLYFRLGKPDWKFHFYGGFNHQVQWGGELLYPDPKNQFSINGKVGSSFNDYLNIVTGRSLAGASDTTKNGANDALNRSGNHLGTIDVGFEITTNDFSVLCYRQNIYEDGSLAYLSNITDGLNGISINIKKTSEASIRVQKIVVEYLNTLSQGGATGAEEINARLRGQDNYFNNGVYTNGWVYQNQTIGTPFINNVDNSSSTLINSKVEAYHIGLLTTLKKIPTTLHLSYNSSHGNFINHVSKKELLSFSAQCLIIMKKGIQVKTIFALDNNSTKNTNVAIGLSLKKNY